MFFACEGSIPKFNCITLKNIYGDLVDEYLFEDITIHDAAVTPDSTRMICAATRTPHAESHLCTSLSGGSTACAPVPVDRNEEMILRELDFIPFILCHSENETSLQLRQKGDRKVN